jgi:predicted RNA-binding Zn-ribbon protein involved in translation (DUF1610 family)
MPKCTACGEVSPGELSENFTCPKCKTEIIWRCEQRKGKLIKYQCVGCGYRGQ